ncbi:hypothetical protein Scep_013229 [Stephania cephalantha]|uniref:Uncharacterized protein n=1 Tax=Stephania cephalantha TaxID=152367 RepID=A0AAP0JGN7_9MAGN
MENSGESLVRSFDSGTNVYVLKLCEQNSWRKRLGKVKNFAHGVSRRWKKLGAVAALSCLAIKISFRRINGYCLHTRTSEYASKEITRGEARSYSKMGVRSVRSLPFLFFHGLPQGSTCGWALRPTNILTWAWCTRPYWTALWQSVPCGGTRFDIIACKHALLWLDGDTVNDNDNEVFSGDALF